jgi:hypothetical protein
VSGTRVAETILASVRMRAHQQAGHMDASDLIKSLQRQPCEEGAVHIWGPDADRRAKLLIYLAVEGSLLDACSQRASPPLRKSLFVPRNDIGIIAENEEHSLAAKVPATF